MDRLWSPWRYAYVTGHERRVKAGVAAELAAWPDDLGCVFCNMVAAVAYAERHGMAAEEAERAAGIVERGERCFLVLNAYPYASGHVMAVPYEHASSLAALPGATAGELMTLTQRAERGAAFGVFAAWDQCGDQYGRSGGCGSCGPPAYSCASAVGGGHEFHDGGCRDAGDSGVTGGQLGPAAGGAGGSRDGLTPA